MCVQVFTDSEERPGEKRIYAVHFNNRHDHLLSGKSGDSGNCHNIECQFYAEVPSAQQSTGVNASAQVPVS